MTYKEEIDKVNDVGLFYKGYNIIALSQVFLFENKLGRYGWGINHIIKKFSLDNLVKFFFVFKLSNLGEIPLLIRLRFAKTDIFEIHEKSRDFTLHSDRF